MGTNCTAITLGSTQTALQKFVNLACSEAGARCSQSVAANTTGRGKNKAAAMVPKITVVRGDALVDFGGGAVGAGLLIVEGDLYMNGNPSWDGIIITLGGDHRCVRRWKWRLQWNDLLAEHGYVHRPMDNRQRRDQLGSTRGGGTAAYNHNCSLVERHWGCCNLQIMAWRSPPTERFKRKGYIW
jgi:hypothetical protein